MYAALGLAPGKEGTFVTLTAHSSALGIRGVNPLNPRAIVFDGVPRDRLSRRRFVAAGFTRGEPIVELVTRDETTQQLRFFVLAVTRACDQRHDCTVADALTEETERGWLAVTLFQDVDLENTALDCLRCHEPSAGAPRILRMQELRFPWTHFLAPRDVTTSGAELVEDYLSVHASERGYAAIPTDLILRGSDPSTLASLLAQEDSPTQPNEFDSFVIDLELRATGRSATWEGLQARASTGEMIPVPWRGLRPTDEVQQATTAAAWRSALASGQPDELPDLRLPFTEEVERATGLRPMLGASGREVLVQACAQCHQPARNQTLTRARFDVLHLDAMSLEQRALARERMQLRDDDPLKMPPPMAMQLSPDELARALETLR